MAAASVISFLSVMLVSFLVQSNGFQYTVGGKDGWVPHPSESYDEWAGRMRFQLNDTLYFEYERGSDSVLEVKEEDYDSCNTENPILRMDDGNTVFEVYRSGPFYFISGNKSNCNQGEKLVAVVLAVRESPPPSIPPVASPPAPSPRVSPTPTPSPPTPSPPTPSPGTTPAPSPSTPSPTPTPGESPAPESAPSSGSPEPSTHSPPRSTAAETHSPPEPSGSATSAFTPAVILASTVSIIITVALPGFIAVPF